MTVDPFTSRSDLLLAARQLGVLFAPYTTALLNNISQMG